MVVIISTVNTPNILVPWFWWFFIFSFVVSKNTYSNQGIQWCGLFAPSGHLIFFVPDFDDFFTFFSFLVSKNIYSSQGNQWCWQIWIVNTPNFLVPDFNIFFTLSMFFRFRRKDLVGISLRILLMSIQISNSNIKNKKTSFFSTKKTSFYQKNKLKKISIDLSKII